MSPGRPALPPDMDLLRFIMRFIVRKGYAPTLRDLCAHLGIASLRGAELRIAKLEDFGYVKCIHGKKVGFIVLRDTSGSKVKLEYKVEA